MPQRCSLPLRCEPKDTAVFISLRRTDWERHPIFKTETGLLHPYRVRARSQTKAISQKLNCLSHILFKCQSQLKAVRVAEADNSVHAADHSRNVPLASQACTRQYQPLTATINNWERASAQPVTDRWHRFFQRPANPL